jgi:hypothetical protein
MVVARVLWSGGGGREEKKPDAWDWEAARVPPLPFSSHGKAGRGAGLTRRRCSFVYGVASLVVMTRTGLERKDN